MQENTFSCTFALSCVCSFFSWLFMFFQQCKQGGGSYRGYLYFQSTNKEAQPLSFMDIRTPLHPSRPGQRCWMCLNQSDGHYKHWNRSSCRVHSLCSVLIEHMFTISRPAVQSWMKTTPPGWRRRLVYMETASRSHVSVSQHFLTPSVAAASNWP